VSVELPDGRKVDGTVTKVETVVESAGNDGGTTTKIEVNVALAGGPAGQSELPWVSSSP